MVPAGTGNHSSTAVVTAYLETENCTSHRWLPPDLDGNRDGDRVAAELGSANAPRHKQVLPGTCEKTMPCSRGVGVDMHVLRSHH